MPWCGVNWLKSKRATNGWLFADSPCFARFFPLSAPGKGYNYVFQVPQNEVRATYLGRLTLSLAVYIWSTFKFWECLGKPKLPSHFQCLLVIFFCLASLLQNEARMITSAARHQTHVGSSPYGNYYTRFRKMSRSIKNRGHALKQTLYLKSQTTAF